MDEPSRKPLDVLSLSKPWFFGLQLILIGAAATWAASRVRERTAERALPPLREKPLEVGPLYDYDFVITDEQLPRALAKLRPLYEGKDTKIYHTDHNLRSWTNAAKFDDPKYMDGEDMLRLLTDHRRFVEVYGPQEKPLLIDEGLGVRVREQEGKASSSHDDHTLACLTEIGLPLDYPVVTPNQTTTFRAILEQSLRDFSLNQVEYEWSALAYVLFLPPAKEWITTEGQVMTFDRLARRIMREALPRGVCSANHRFHALVMFLRVDDMMEDQGEPRILAPEVRQEIIAYLHNVVATLVKNQHPDGFWNRNYMDGPATSSQPTDRDGDKLDDRIIATGHVMEWLALAPQELHPPRAVLAAAGQWLVRTIDSLTPAQTQQFASFLSHVSRALALWRGRTPAEVNLQQAVAELNAKSSSSSAASEQPASDKPVEEPSSADPPDSESERDGNNRSDEPLRAPAVARPPMPEPETPEAPKPPATEREAPAKEDASTPDEATSPPAAPAATDAAPETNS